MPGEDKSLGYTLANTWRKTGTLQLSRLPSATPVPSAASTPNRTSTHHADLLGHAQLLLNSEQVVLGCRQTLLQGLLVLGLVTQCLLKLSL